MRSGKLETLTNVVTILLSLLLSAVLVKQFVLPYFGFGGSATASQVRKGVSLKDSLPGVDWVRNGRTLVMAISTQCHFCTESAPFYQKIANERGKDAKLLAVLPQPVAEAHTYLERGGVVVDDVRQMGLDSLGVRRIPTLMLVDKSGKIADIW